MRAQYEDYERVWQAKDHLPRELQFLQPLSASDGQVARMMVGPRQLLLVTDSANQTLTASAVQAVSFTANNLVTGSWSPPPAGAGIFYENLRAAIQETDASGKIQIVAPVLIAPTNNIVGELGMQGFLLPVTFAAVANTYLQFVVKTPCPPYLPSDGAFTNGPVAQFVLVNTDGAGSHTYKRLIGCIYRYIYDIDYTKERVYITGTLR